MCLIRLPQLGQVGSLGLFIRRPRHWRRGAAAPNRAPLLVRTGQSEGARGTGERHPIPNCQYVYRIFRRSILTPDFLLKCLSAQPIRRRCTRRNSLYQDPGHQAPALAHSLPRPTKVAAIALVNEIARMEWAMMAKSERLTAASPPSGGSA